MSTKNRLGVTYKYLVYCPTNSFSHTSRFTFIWFDTPMLDYTMLKHHWFIRVELRKVPKVPSSSFWIKTCVFGIEFNVASWYLLKVWIGHMTPPPSIISSILKIVTELQGRSFMLNNSKCNFKGNIQRRSQKFWKKNPSIPSLGYSLIYPIRTKTWDLARFALSW